MTSEGHSALLHGNVGRRPLLQRGLMNFQRQFFQLYDKSLKDWSVGKQLVLFPSGPVIKGTSQLMHTPISIKVASEKNDA